MSDERVGPLGLRRRDEPPPRREQPRQLGDRLGQAGDRELAVVVDEPAAGRGELRAAEAGDRRASGSSASSSRVSAPA